MWFQKDIRIFMPALQVASLTETLHKKEAEMAGMEERYKKYMPNVSKTRHYEEE